MRNKTVTATIRYTALSLLLFLFSFAPANAQDPGVPDSMIFGNFDGTPILAGLNVDIVVPIYIKTDDSVNFAHIPMATDDNYIASRNGGVEYEPLSLWDDASFLNPNFDSPTVGFTSQSILGFAYLFDPRDPQNFFMTNGEWWYIADFHLTTTDNIAVLGDTMQLIEGFNPANGELILGLSDGSTEIDPEVVWGSIYFPPNTPPAYMEPQGGTMPINEQFGVCLNVSATDEDDDNMILTVDFGPNNFTFVELINEPGEISYQFCWVPEAGAAGDYPITFTIDDGNGGVIDLDILFEVTPTGIIISDGSSLPGETISLPVLLDNQGVSSAVGGFDILVSWNPTALSLNDVIRAGRLGTFEYFFVNQNDAGEGTVRVVGIADLSFGAQSPPLAPDSGSIFFLDFSVSNDENLIGVDLPITFLTLDQADNTLSDSTGYLLVSPNQYNGLLSVVGPGDILTGDINLNGIAYEVGDIVLFVNHLVNPGEFPFSSVQLEASDINADGIPATVADLVLLVNIVNGIVPPPRIDPIPTNILVTAVEENGIINFVSSSSTPVGAILLKISHDAESIALDEASEYDVAYSDDNGELTALFYRTDGQPLFTGETTLFSIEADHSSIEFIEASSADIYGNMLEVIYKVDAPLPLNYELTQNYPNPFNANTMISFGLPMGDNVRIEVYNIIGQKVNTLADDYFDAGRYDIVWNGLDSNGDQISSGVYLYRLVTGSDVLTKKMTLLK